MPVAREKGREISGCGSQIIRVYEAVLDYAASAVFNDSIGHRSALARMEWNHRRDAVIPHRRVRGASNIH